MRADEVSTAWAGEWHQLHFCDEACHMNFAFEVIDRVREENPELFDEEFHQNVSALIKDAIECEHQFGLDLMSGGVAGITPAGMKEYLESWPTSA